MPQEPVLCVTGPTGSGKSASCAELAERWPVEIINVDSATIYRGMDIGTAKPSQAEQQRITHHLLDIRDPAETYSAATFRDDALALIKAIRQRNAIPVLCGGTMLYYRALQYGLNKLPQASSEIRHALDDEAARRGWPALHAELAQVDSQSAARLAPHDSQRIQRALEIWRVSGRTMTDWLAAAPRDPGHNLTFSMISLEPADRAGLHERIKHRFHAMLDAGLEEEVRALHERTDLHPGLPSVRCVGYRQLWAWLDGDISQHTAIERAIAATRQLAKRQLTWLRSTPQRHVIDCLSPDAADRVVDRMATLRSTPLTS